MTDQPYFEPSLFRFLGALRANNSREWFQANRDRYESEVRDPMLRFIGDFAPRLRQISPRFVADPRPSGGSLFRIHRDVRFSRDKSPYKTNAGAHFRHQAGKSAHAPGFYLHVEPGAVFAAAGVWHPDAKTLARIRDAIVHSPGRWRRVTSSQALGGAGALGGDTLKRPPQGYDPEHPLIDDLKRKDFFAVAEFSQAEACAPDFMDSFTATCRSFAPVTRFLTEALALPW